MSLIINAIQANRFATVKGELKLVEAENSEIHNEIEVLRGTYVKGLNRLEGDLEGLKHSLVFVASQEVGCNHAQSVGFSTDGFATTLTMRELHLIWVTARMHIEICKYPAWSDVVEIETWCQGEGSDWILKDYATGEVIGRATSYCWRYNPIRWCSKS